MDLLTPRTPLATGPDTGTIIGAERNRDLYPHSYIGEICTDFVLRLTRTATMTQ